MAANATFASILSEMQLSYINFAIKVTPFAAYITLKKTVQKNLNGNLTTPSPPLHFLLQQTQGENQNLREEISHLKSCVNSIENKYGAVEHENKGLVESLEEIKKAVDDVTNTKNNLRNNIEDAKKKTVRNLVEKSEIEF